MKIYVDFDDVICETARSFTELAKELFGIGLPFREVQFFNLQKSFGLSDAQYAELMRAGHTPECLLAYEVTPGAPEVLNRWADAGHEVLVVTGRPSEAFAPSRAWLDGHGLARLPLFFVDKYGRETARPEQSFSMTPEELYRIPFGFAVEDSPAAFAHLLQFADCRVAVFDRPWNRREALPDARFVRCAGWPEIDALLKTCEK